GNACCGHPIIDQVNPPFGAFMWRSQNWPATGSAPYDGFERYRAAVTVDPANDPDPNPDDLWTLATTISAVRYDIAPDTGTLASGGSDIGNHCDDCLTQIGLPFPFNFYGASYSVASVSSNGNIQFGTPGGTYPAAFTNDCPLPSASQISGPAIFAHWDD